MKLVELLLSDDSLYAVITLEELATHGIAAVSRAALLKGETIVVGTVRARMVEHPVTSGPERATPKWVALSPNAGTDAPAWVDGLRPADRDCDDTIAEVSPTEGATAWENAQRIARLLNEDERRLSKAPLTREESYRLAELAMVQPSAPVASGEATTVDVSALTADDFLPLDEDPPAQPNASHSCPDCGAELCGYTDEDHRCDLAAVRDRVRRETIEACANECLEESADDPAHEEVDDQARRCAVRIRALAAHRTCAASEEKP